MSGRGKSARTGGRLSRRKFIHLAVATAASAPLYSCSSSASSWRFFSEQEGRALQAICNQIIPADKDPGAGQAGVVDYIDRQMVGHFKRRQEMYRTGLAAVEQSSRSIFGNPFAELTAEQQIKILEKMEHNEVPAPATKENTAGQFLELVIEHTMQGFYGDPRHGGNREGVSWRMLGVPYPPIRGRLHYDLTKPLRREKT